MPADPDLVLLTQLDQAALTRDPYYAPVCGRAAAAIRRLKGQAPPAVPNSFAWWGTPQALAVLKKPAAQPEQATTLGRLMRWGRNGGGK
jgi:hypothetical protein